MPQPHRYEVRELSDPDYGVCAVCSRPFPEHLCSRWCGRQRHSGACVPVATVAEPS